MLTAAHARSGALETLEARLGDPWDEANPVGFAAVLAADEREEMLAAGEALLDELGLNAEFVPAEYGGRFGRLDRLIAMMRAVYRRDPSLGLGYGATSFLAAVNVWAAGSPAQCRAVADLLLRDRKLACGYHELSHGNDLARADCEALPRGDALVLRGGKQVISNAARGDALVVFARTAPGPGSRTHSLLLVVKDTVAAERIGYSERYRSAGLRGVQLGGIVFRDLALPAGALIGPAGHGIETALTSFQLTRIALPGMFLGVLESGLRATLRYALGRRLYGRSVASLPQTRAVLAEAFADLLLCDCFTAVAARAAHLLPGEAGVYAAAVKLLVPGILIGAMNRLAAVLGAQFYLRGGEHAIFQKLLRDVKPAGFGHASRASCQLTLLPQLPLLARRSWLAGAAAPPAVFRLGDELPPLRYDQLVPSAGGRERLSGALPAAVAALAAAPEQREILRLAEGFVAELAALKAACGRLAPPDVSVTASSEAYDLTTRYAVVLAASAALGVWLHAPGDDPFRRDPAWIAALLGRLRALAGGLPEPLPDDVVERLYAQLAEHCAAGLPFDLARPWHHPAQKERP